MQVNREFPPQCISFEYIMPDSTISHLNLFVELDSESPSISRSGLQFEKFLMAHLPGGRMTYATTKSS